MFCPFTNIDCVGANCVMWDQAEEKDADGNEIGPEQSCLQRIRLETQIDFMNTASEVLEDGMPGLPQPTDTPPVTPAENQPPV